MYKGTGGTLPDVWEDAVQRTLKNLEGDAAYPLWVRADVVSESRIVTRQTVDNAIDNTAPGFGFKGISLDEEFETALLEGELNGRGIYDYEADSIDLDRLNEWLAEVGKKPLREIPEHLTLFECWGWFCDEDDTVYPLHHDGADTGRREVPTIDAGYAKDIIGTASSYLVNQVGEDGKFIYGIYPQYDEEIDSYNILRHSGTIWSLICRYRMLPDESLKKTIEKTIEYMISQVRYDEL